MANRRLSEEEIETIAAKWVDTMRAGIKEGMLQGQDSTAKRISIINLFMAFYDDVQEQQSIIPGSGGITETELQSMLFGEMAQRLENLLMETMVKAAESEGDWFNHVRLTVNRFLYDILQEAYNAGKEA